jgi:hypothetical protein
MSRGAVKTSGRSTKQKPQELRPRSSLFGFQAEKFVPALVEKKQAAAFVPTGLGKTGSTLTALVDLGMPRTLVVVPARVAEMRVWTKEAASWEHTQGVRVITLDGSPKRRVEYLDLPADVNVISYNLFEWLCDHFYMEMEKRYGAIVFDELSMLKHAGSTRFKRVRTRTEGIDIRFGLTASPRGNHLRDIWAEMYAVAGEKPLGPSKVQFDMQYFTAYEIAEHVKGWAVNFGAEEMIFERIKPWAFSLDPADAPKWELRLNPIHIPLPKDVEKLSEDLSRDLKVQLASGTELVALMAGTRAAKIRQMTSGFVYTDPVLHTWERIHDHKLDALEELVEGLQGEPAMLGYWYKPEREMILERFPQARELKSKEDEEAWNRGEIELLLTHPASVGHGLNLQFGGHNLVWYSIPPSWELWQQLNGRLSRPGQISPFCMAHVLLAGATDLAAFMHLKEKGEGQDRLVRAVEI